MPVLAAEGGDARNLARLASRLARANAAVEVLVDGAARYLALGIASIAGFDANSVLQPCRKKSGCASCCARSTGSAMKDRLNSARAKPCWRRWTGRLPKRPGRQPRLKQTLAGAMINLTGDRIYITPAPPRRRRAN